MTETVTFDDFNKNLRDFVASSKRLCEKFQLLERSQKSRYEGKGERLIMTLSLSSLFKTLCFPKCLMSGKL